MDSRLVKGAGCSQDSWIVSSWCVCASLTPFFWCHHPTLINFKHASHCSLQIFSWVRPLRPKRSKTLQLLYYYTQKPAHVPIDTPACSHDSLRYHMNTWCGNLLHEQLSLAQVSSCNLSVDNVVNTVNFSLLTVPVHSHTHLIDLILCGLTRLWPCCTVQLGLFFWLFFLSVHFIYGREMADGLSPRWDLIITNMHNFPSLPSPSCKGQRPGLPLGQVQHTIATKPMFLSPVARSLGSAWITLGSVPYRPSTTYDRSPSWVCLPSWL